MKPKHGNGAVITSAQTRILQKRFGKRLQAIADKATDAFGSIVCWNAVCCQNQKLPMMQSDGIGGDASPIFWTMVLYCQ